MESATLALEQTWRWLWSYSAHQIISALVLDTDYERIAVGAGWGLRDPGNIRRALLLHPSGDGRATGDLTLTIPGVARYVIPRYGADYVEYLGEVAVAVQAVASAYLAIPLEDQAE
jgi:hypothetical protein